jgi:vancomycin resistance protein YoaR
MNVSKWLKAGAAVVVLGIVASGCRTMPVTSSVDTPFQKMQEQAAQITDQGGLAAVGVGTSSSIQLALEKAKTRGRAELAQIVETKVETMRKSFTEEVGESKIQDYDAMFTAVSKVVASQVLRGTVARDMRYDMQGGKITAWALMVQNPKLLADVFEAQLNAQKALLTRFRASTAFQELEKEVKAFEAYKKEQGLLR